MDSDNSVNIVATALSLITMVQCFVNTRQKALNVVSWNT